MPILFVTSRELVYNRKTLMSVQEKMLPIGTVLEGRYRLISEGTSQDLGTTHKAYDMQRDRLVVVLALASRFGSGAEVWERLTRSQQGVAGLAQPGLIPFEHIGLVDGQLYLVRNHLEGQTLADLLARIGHLEVGAAVEIAIRLCEALAPAHRVGLVHGGLSPHSVLLGDGGQMAVIDTGLLPALRPVSAPPGQPWGRFPYLSAEQAAGEDVHPASDVYAIGSLLYEMLTGRPPFRAGDRTALARQHLRQEPPALQILMPHIPLSLAQIVHKALAKEPAARYRNAGQLAHILRSQLGSWLAPRPPEAAAPHRAPARKHLVVPSPPTPSPPVMAQTAREPCAPGAEAGEWDEEPAGADWLMIALIVAALIAVLGLIPLWRTVYRHYAVPPPAPTPISYRLPDGNASSARPCIGRQESQPEGITELDDFRLVWYNQIGNSAYWLGGQAVMAALQKGQSEKKRYCMLCACKACTQHTTHFAR